MGLSEKPVPALRDHARAVGDAAVSAVPVVGGAAAVLIDHVLRPSYEKRLDRWLGELDGIVRDLEARMADGDATSLVDDDTFVDAVTRATQIALGTSIEGKLTMLRTALLSVALEPPASDFVAMRFLDLVDELGLEHFALLRYSRDPSALGAPPTIASTPRAAIDRAGLPFRPNLTDLLLRDLASRGLIDPCALSETALGAGAQAAFITDLGEELLDFVRAFE
jgi:hypothetical protein